MVAKVVDKELAELKRLLQVMRNRNYDCSDEIRKIQERIAKRKAEIEKAMSDEARKKTGDLLIF
jgi:chaperonin cofactor prefoldin